MNHSRGRRRRDWTSEWRKRRSPRSRAALAGTSGWTEGRVLARSDRSGPIELLAARYPVIRRLVGEANSGDGMIERWVAEAAIVARPLLEVEARRLPSGGYAFLHAPHGGNRRRDVDDAKVVVGIQETA